MPETFSYPSHACLHSYKGKQFPLYLAPPSHKPDLAVSASAVVHYFDTHRDEILSLLEAHTVLYFHGFAADTSTPEDFAAFLTDGLGLQPFPYTLGNAVRKSIVGDVVFTANEAPPDKLIPFHHELAQTPTYPSYVSFFCDLPAQLNGETPIVNSIEVYEQLQARIPHFIHKCETHGMHYQRYMTEHDRKESAIGRGWKNTFNAKCEADVEDILSSKKYEWSWETIGDSQVLKEISPRLDVVKLLPDGKKAFFNQIYAAWNGWVDEFNEQGHALKFGNGDAVDINDMNVVNEILNKCQVAIPWQRGDFMVIDNFRAMHSRNTFSGKRAILASLSK